MTLYTLSEIFIYPVKSLGGIQLKSSEVGANGLKYDRHWMIIDANNRFLSQRELPAMSLIKTSIHENDLILTHADDSISLPLDFHEKNSVNTTIWRDQCLAHPISSTVDQWLSDHLQLSCRLVKQGANIRQVDQRYAGPSDQTSFSDGFPFLILSDSSLADLNSKLEHMIPIQRFRPNLVISGCAAYAEDRWRKIKIGAIPFRLPKPCSRCSITTIDTETGQNGKEPLKTLNRLRKWKNEVFFGQNALHEQTGILKTGDTVQILETGPSQPPIEN